MSLFRGRDLTIKMYKIGAACFGLGLYTAQVIICYKVTDGLIYGNYERKRLECRNDAECEIASIAGDEILLYVGMGSYTAFCLFSTGLFVAVMVYFIRSRFTARKYSLETEALPHICESRQMPMMLTCAL